MMDQESFCGTIERIIFHNSENSFSIIVFLPQTQQSVSPRAGFIVKGHIPAPYVGQDVEICGSWTTHDSFGKQFLATTCKQLLPTNISGISRYLSSGCIKGIGEKYAKAIVAHFGKTTLTVIDEFPEQLINVPGIGEKRAQQITASWKEQKNIASLMVFLQEKGISQILATKIYKKYSDQTRAILTENPYRLAADIWGIGFLTADAIAQKMGFALTDHRRIHAGILYALKHITTSGHLYIEQEASNTTFHTLLSLDTSHDTIIADTLSALCEQNIVHIFTGEQKKYVGLHKHYAIEQRCAKLLGENIKTKSKIKAETIEKKIEQYFCDPSFLQISLTQQQKIGVCNAFKHKISIITGGPGTGKTTLLKTIILIAEAEALSYKLSAPTGRAAQRMYESSGKKALTMHRLLEYDIGIMGFKRNSENQLKTNLIIIDEASMIDIFLAHSLLEATNSLTHIVFIGDCDQLPSVGPGHFFADCITSEVFPITRLHEIFRQTSNSMIVTNAHRINKGEMPLFECTTRDQDFIFIKEDNPENLEQHLKRSLFLIAQRYGIDPMRVQILVPMNRGLVGTQTLNPLLQNMLNGNKTNTLAYGSVTYRVNDRVMQLCNNYNKDVFNGDIGIINAINTEAKKITVLYEAKQVEYAIDEINEITLAYATTIHKSQGSEYAAVIIPLFMQHYVLLQRNLLYTAITRAKKLCILIGEPRAIAYATKNNKSIQRNTCLSHFLKTL